MNNGTNLYLIFLDIDGVLTSERTWAGSTCDNSDLWDKFDPIAIDFFNWIHDRWDVHFVLLTTWKNGLDPNNSHHKLWVSSALRNAGFRGHIAPDWMTNPNHFRMTRGEEVVEYLDTHSIYDDFLIFDDNAFDYQIKTGVKRLVRTDAHNGLLYNHMTRAKSLLGQWEKK